jgi:plasmid stabilization system protein ParE
MKIVYSKRAVADVRKLSSDSRRSFGDKAAEALGTRIRATIEHIGREPYTGHELRQKPEVYVFALVRYPYKIFYRILDGGVRVQHIRHTSRKSLDD